MEGRAQTQNLNHVLNFYLTSGFHTLHASIYARKNYATVEIHTKRHYGAYEYDYEYDLHDTSENYAL